ncbi:hypothetical protein NliqN6_4944 [Naganishia liquefaciens]|uniref:Atos-like conserved domain-containing protein n=1 Tax=Naganishia liquefaciens TaxID=104408 RepID=A0A8H3YHU2_9TREE|nr:hypothetical protein NliqN6_4944 [Naganishia liquefaciens]
MVAAETPTAQSERRPRHAVSSSPICRSPLSQQHSFRTDSPTPIHIASGPSNVSSHSPGIALSPRRLSTSRSLAGSYTLSLLSSRMSAAHPTHHVPSAFTLKIGSVSTGRQVRSSLRCPEHVKIAFDARWHELEGAGAAAWTPWVGNVDVEGWYRHQRRLKTLEWARAQRAQRVALSESAVDDEEDEGGLSTMPDLDAYYERILKGWIPTIDDIMYAPPADRPLLRRMRCPPRPGYEVGVSGKMQFFIMQTLDQPSTTASPSASAKTASTPVKVFLVDYDLGSLEPGGRLLYKERAYQTIHDDAQRTPGSSSPIASPKMKSRAREILKYAFELHFLCLETPRKTSHPPSKGDSGKRKRACSTAPGRAYYLGKQIRLVFPTSSSNLNTTDGTPATRTAHVPPVPSIRVERLIEVQNPVPVADERPLARDAAAASLKSGSFTSESWQGLRELKEQEAAASIPENPSDTSNFRDSARFKPKARTSAEPGTTLPPSIIEEGAPPSGLVFTRSPTPIQPMTLKSPSLLTARLEEMSSLSPQISANALCADPSGQGDEQSRMAGANGSRKRTLWPPDDTERLLSESLQKLPVSYR